MEEPNRQRESDLGAGDAQTQSIRFLLNVINSTIYTSGDDYDGALTEFFPQLQALGSLIGARDLDEVSEFLRQRSLWQ